MSTQTVPQSSQATSQETAPATTAAVAKKEKKQKMTDAVVATLRALPEGQLMTIEEVENAVKAKMPGLKGGSFQSTLSQLVKANRVEKVKTGKRMPGYKATK